MERSSAVPVFVGIDVAKDRLDVHPAIGRGVGGRP